MADGGERVDVARHDAGIDEVVRLLDFRILQTRLLESCRMGEAVHVHHEDQLHRSPGFDPLLSRSQGERPMITGDDRGQPIGHRIVSIHAVLERDI
ncbi:MAG: hypothetical protein WB440_13050 [Steroidobacteraceae bacterium]|jgi:hypothetical protein